MIGCINVFDTEKKQHIWNLYPHALMIGGFFHLAFLRMNEFRPNWNFWVQVWAKEIMVIFFVIFFFNYLGEMINGTSVLICFTI